MSFHAKLSILFQVRSKFGDGVIGMENPPKVPELVFRRTVIKRLSRILVSSEKELQTIGRIN